MIEDYTVCWHFSKQLIDALKDLKSVVFDYLMQDEGWEPVGGVSIEKSIEGFYVAQTMVRRKQYKGELYN